MTTTTRRQQALALALSTALGLALAACPLPSNVRYRCEPDRTCAQAGYTCAADDYCYPGACTPRDTTAECAQVECGLVSDGCGGTADCGKWCPEGMECGVDTPNVCGMAKLCAGGWCWENPLPQGATLYDAFRADALHTWFVGELGTVLFFDGQKSRLEPLPTDAPATFYGVDGTSRSDLYVVGTDGLIFHFDGTSWTKEGISSGVTATLRAVVALPGGNAVAVGEAGRALYREPSAPVDRRWRESTSGVMATLVDVAALGDGGVLALTDDGRLLSMRGDMLTWSPLPAAVVPMQRTNALAARGGRVYVGGAMASPRVTLGRLEDDGGWASVSDAGREVTDLFVAGDELWAVGQSWAQALGPGDDGPSLLGTPPGTPASGPTATPWLTGVGLQPGEALLGGRLGVMAVARPDAGVLLMRSQGSVRDVNAVCGAAPGAMYGASTVEVPSVGCGGGTCRPRVLERIEAPAGAYWRALDTLPLGGTTELLACYAFGPNHAWLMGNDSKFFYQSGGSWEPGDFGGAVAGQYRAGWGLPDAGYVFVRDGQPTLTVSDDGLTAFTEQSVSGTSVALGGVWGVSGDDVLLVGDQGSVRRRVAGQWQDVTSGLTTGLNAVYGATLVDGGVRYVAAGEAGRAFTLESDGTTTAPMTGDTTRFTGAWVSSSGMAWLAGYDDLATPKAVVAVQAGPGGEWQALPTPWDRPLSGVFGLDLGGGQSAVWIAGPGGLILRHDVR